jgi:hypothetical protein
MLADLALRVERLRTTDETDFVEKRTLNLTDEAEGKPRPPANVKFLRQWLPWAIECTHEWVRRLRRSPRPDRDAQRRILAGLETLERLTGAPLADALARADNHMTEDLTEFHLALGRLLSASR